MTDQSAPLDEVILQILHTKAAGVTRKEILDDLLNAGHTVKSTGSRGNATTGQLQTVSSKLDAMKRKGLLVNTTETTPNGRLVYWSLNPERFPRETTPAPAFLTAHPPATPSLANALTEHLMQTLQHSLQNEETHTGFVPQTPRDHLDDLAHRYRSPTIRLQIQINPDTLDTLLQLLHQLSCVMSDDIADYLRTLSETLHNAEELS